MLRRWAMPGDPAAAGLIGDIRRTVDVAGFAAKLGSHRLDPALLVQHDRNCRAHAGELLMLLPGVALGALFVGVGKSAARRCPWLVSKGLQPAHGRSHIS